MNTSPLIKRVPRHFKKRITFDGSAGGGAVGTVALATVTGAVTIVGGGIRCTTNLAGATATLSLGTAGNVDGVVEATLATDIDENDFWQNASPEVKVSPAIVNINVGGNLILTVGVADITAGVLEFSFYWLPLSDNGNMV